METRRTRIELLSRINRGRAAAPKLLRDLSEALGEDLDVSALRSLPETDALFQASLDKYQAAIRNGTNHYRRLFLESERPEVLRIADCLADHLGIENAFLLTKLSRYCGAINVSLASILRHTASIIRLDGDSLSAISSDRTQGILIDHNPDNHSEAYEFVVWGDRWLPRALACDPIDY
jgi:hypothetical protein